MEVEGNSKKRKEPEEDMIEENEDDLSFVEEMSVSELREVLKERNIKSDDIVEKKELIERVRQQFENDKKEGIPLKRNKSLVRRDCPYLDTIDRKLLDFDFEKLCSVTLVNLNVYACLVCGKYFQGRGRNSQAHLHSLAANHHVFINLQDERVYCLPEGYEVFDPSLQDIKYCLNPKFTPEEAMRLDSNTKLSQALDGTTFIPGYVGLNNIKHTDFINVAVQALVHVPPFRNFFIVDTNYKKCTDLLVLRFGELVRKIYNAKNFKDHVDPHELLQAIVTVSEKKFQIGVLGDPMEFIQWFLNHVHRALGGTKKSGSSIVHQVFQGLIEVTTLKEKTNSQGERYTESKTEVVPFLNLALDVPPPPLFKDETEKNIIPQIPIFDLLTKFDGEHETYIPKLGERKKFKLVKLPPYLILHFKRFTKNTFFMEKNPTIVTSPLKHFDFGPYLRDLPKKSDITKYDLIANIVNEGEPAKGSYKAHIYQKVTNQWHEMEDIVVKPIMPQLIALSESYIQVYEKQSK